MFFPPSPRSSFYEGGREIIEASSLEEFKGSHRDVRIVASAGETYASEGVDTRVEEGKVLVIFNRDVVKAERLF